MRRTFLVEDYYVKRSEPCYDVVFEDTGPDDLNILDPRSVLSMVKDAELVYVSVDEERHTGVTHCLHPQHTPAQS
jgi:hypothetical protein